ncbi:MAG: hypothetical protein C0499_05680, partial [Zymomonas sp.]|nr:hypothetical protein [Zymomonas sp.]
MPRDYFAEAIDAMRCAGQSIHPVNISAPACRAILARLAYLEHDNDTLRKQHAAWHHYASTDLTPAQMEMRLREIEAETPATFRGDNDQRHRGEIRDRPDRERAG